VSFHVEDESENAGAFRVLLDFSLYNSFFRDVACLLRSILE
jgi:hypothetical protein